MTGRLTAEEIKKWLKMTPLPEEGGFYVEVHRSPEKLGKSGLPARFPADRNLSTDIYYLLPKGEKSKFHRIKGEEIWHFFMGDPFTLVEIAPNRKVTATVMGNDIRAGQALLHVVPPGNWFGCFPNEGSEYSLVSCTVIPGFEFEDFEVGKRENLSHQFPDAKEYIEILT